MSEDFYSDAADFGKLVTTITAVVVSVFMGLLILFGVYELFKKDTHPEAVEGQVLSATCDQVSKDSYKCNVTASYTVNGVQYTVSDVINPSDLLKVGDNVTVGYVKENPANAVIERFTQKQVGIASLVIAALVLIFVWFQVWLVRRYKFIAAGKGAFSIFNLFR